jgi:type I restriction enzyme R subunit
LKTLKKSRMTYDDASIGAMVICDSADQAKQMHAIFTAKYAKNVQTAANILDLPMAAEARASYTVQNKNANKVKNAADPPRYWHQRRT